MGNTFRYLFVSDKSEDTCKERFDFDLKEIDGELYIDNISIKGETGCLGHPKTISALLKNRKISDLPMEVLDSCTCRRKFSCGQQLVKAIKQLNKERTIR